ncbi:ABC transporter substrate-binding protein [Streptomyces sp. NPDC002588]|uniref:ABC transporter substrate-binding protein n=1 Tax=Streptomyces sp. NPDC002588 TaxID=3154419 RepID=UPI00332C9691
MSKNRSVAAVLAGALCLVTAGCAGSSNGTASDKASVSASGSGYPVTVTNCGQTETFAKAPGRVVVMNGGSVAEVSTLLALGLGDRIVANEQTYGMSEVAGRAKAIKALPAGDIELNDAGDIPSETMLSLRPDFVLSVTAYGFDAQNGFATRRQLRTVGANSYVSPQGCDDDPSRMTISDSYTLLRDMGKIFDVSARAEQLIAASEKSIAAVSAKVKGEKKSKVMVLFAGTSMDNDTFEWVAAKGIFNDILAKAGGTNVFESASRTVFADLSKEKVAATDVDALVVLGAGSPDPTAYAKQLLKEFPQWPAAKNNTYTVLSDSIYLGPSNDLAVDRIARMLHPDAF